MPIKETYNYFEIYLILVRMTTIKKINMGEGMGKGIINLFTDIITTVINIEASHNIENKITIQLCYTFWGTYPQGSLSLIF